MPPFSRRPRGLHAPGSIRSIERIDEQLEQGPVTPNYRGDPALAVQLMNEALATELVCVLRYKAHYYCAKGIHGPVAAEEFLEHAKDEQEHADRIALRIRQLGGKPDFNPEGLEGRSHARYAAPDRLVDMIIEDLVAERVAVEAYRELVRHFGDDDPTSRRLFEEILAQEEDHADDMADLLATLDTAASGAEPPAGPAFKARLAEPPKARPRRPAGGPPEGSAS
jgi:bacterioferritin